MSDTRIDFLYLNEKRYDRCRCFGCRTLCGDDGRSALSFGKRRCFDGRKKSERAWHQLIFKGIRNPRLPSRGFA